MISFHLVDNKSQSVNSRGQCMAMHDVLLKINNITKSYGSKRALKGVSFDIHEGEIFALLGVNGAGKTTLSGIIATLHPPTSGDIEFKGDSIYHDIITYRSHLGFCQQKPNLDPMLTLSQNLRFSAAYYQIPEERIEKRITTLADQFGLKPFLHKKASVLSGGYKQRFMIVRSLMHNPKLLLLDEPTVALDPHVRRQLWGKIKDLKDEGVTIILTTHYLDEAENLADRVCVLDNGSVKLIDTPEKLKSDFKKKNLEDVFIELTQDTIYEEE